MHRKAYGIKIMAMSPLMCHKCQISVRDCTYSLVPEDLDLNTFDSMSQLTLLLLNYLLHFQKE